MQMFCWKMLNISSKLCEGDKKTIRCVQKQKQKKKQKTNKKQNKTKTSKQTKNKNKNKDKNKTNKQTKKKQKKNKKQYRHIELFSPRHNPNFNSPSLKQTSATFPLFP